MTWNTSEPITIGIDHYNKDRIRELAEANDMTESDIMSLLCEYMDNMIYDYHLKRRKEC